jgi:hypothetical protein
MMFGIDLRAQQIAQIDLVRHETRSTELKDTDVEPSNCGDSLQYNVHGDGVIVTTDVTTDKKPKLKMDLTLPKQTLERGERIEAQIQLENVGSDAVVIPWSSDPHTSKRPSGVVEHEYEMGWFDFQLKNADKRKTSVSLESQSNFLYASTSNPDSVLRIEPGQWLLAKIQFLVEGKRNLSVSLPINLGKAEISAEWRQARFTWQKDGCAVKTGYLSYVYEEHMQPIPITVVK